MAVTGVLAPNFNAMAQAETSRPKQKSITFFQPAKNTDTQWKWKFDASHAYTHYFPTDLSFKTSQYNATIKDYTFDQRRGEYFLNPKNWFKNRDSNPLRLIDETTNTYTLAAEKNAHIVSFSMFHPKFIQTPGQLRHIEGTVNGAAVNGMGLVENPGPAQKGKLNLELNQNTYMSLEFEAGYAHRFNLISTSKFGNITYVPGISGGLHAGKTYSSTVDSKGDRQEYKEKFSVQGGGGSIRNKIEWLSPREKIGVFYENKFSLYHREHDLLDGSQKYNLAYSSNSFGVSVMINNPNKHNQPQNI